MRAGHPPPPGPPPGAGARRQAAAQLGRRAEELAAEHYARAGFTLERNWRCRLGELDLVCRRRRLLVVCEVKARSRGALGAPAEAVGAAKQRRLRRLAAAYLAGRDEAAVAVRFDVALLGASGVLEVLEGAF